MPTGINSFCVIQYPLAYTRSTQTDNKLASNTVKTSGKESIIAGTNALSPCSQPSLNLRAALALMSDELLELLCQTTPKSRALSNDARASAG